MAHVSEMTYTVSSGALNSTIPYHTFMNSFKSTVIFGSQFCALTAVTRHCTCTLQDWCWRSAGHLLFIILCKLQAPNRQSHAVEDWIRCRKFRERLSATGD